MQYVFIYGKEAQKHKATLTLAARKSWGDSIEIVERGRLLYACPMNSASRKVVYQEGNKIGFLAGYIFNNSLNSNQSESEHVVSFFESAFQKAWPHPKNFSGSYSASMINLRDAEIIFLNDVMGPYKLFYGSKAGTVFGGTNSVVLAKTLSLKPDVVGITQAITPPYFSNYSRASLFQDLSKLIPGEYIHFSESGHPSRKFDNEMYKECKTSNLDALASETHELLKSEITQSVQFEKKISLALSGGWDSRILLAVLADQKKEIQCLTYGRKSHYETKIAKKCAALFNYELSNHDYTSYCFPNKDDILNNFLNSGSTAMMQWWGIKESGALKNNPLLLIGEGSGLINGRGVVAYKNRIPRIKSFFRGAFGQKDPFVPASPNEMKKWRNEIRELWVVKHLKRLNSLHPGLLEYDANLYRDQFFDQIDLLIHRVEDNQPLLMECVDELFNNHINRRHIMCEQYLQLLNQCRPITPGMSSRTMKFISTIHPELRIRQRLLDKVIRLLNQKSLLEIPTANIPFIKQSRPKILKEMVWASVRTIDLFMQRFTMKTGIVIPRYTLQNSFNFFSPFLDEDNLRNYQSYFSDTFFSGNEYRELFERQRTYQKTPGHIYTFIYPARISLVLDDLYGPSRDTVLAKNRDLCA